MRTYAISFCWPSRNPKCAKGAGPAPGGFTRMLAQREGALPIAGPMLAQPEGRYTVCWPDAGPMLAHRVGGGPVAGISWSVVVLTC